MMKPLYTGIIEYVMGKIVTNEWKVGDMLPKEIDLCKQFNVSRPTVRAALLNLVNEGRLTRIKGKGTFVSKPKLVGKSTIFIESFAEEMKNLGKIIKTEVMEYKHIQANAKIAEKLDIKERAKVLKIKRLRYARNSFNKGPIVLTSSYFKETMIPLLEKYDFEKVSMHEVFSANNIERKTIEKEISVKVLNGKDCRLLGEPENSLAVFIMSVLWDNKDRILEYSESCYPADKNRFIIRISN